MPRIIPAPRRAGNARGCAATYSAWAPARGVAMSPDTLPNQGRLQGFTHADGPSAVLATNVAGIAEAFVFLDAAAGKAPDVSHVLQRVSPLYPAGLDEHARETAAAAARRAATAAARVCLEATRHAMHCPVCGGPSKAGPGAGPHFGRLVCRDCGRFLRWLPKPSGQGGRR